MKRYLAAAISIFVIAFMAVGLMGCGEKEEENGIVLTPNEAQSEASGEYATGIHHAEVTVEGYGTFTIELNADVAPITVSNFCALASDGFYDGLTFHRCIEDFCLQGGDPAGNGTGGSANAIKGEFSGNGVNNSLADNFGTGVVAMARSSMPDSASSQFFIALSDNPNVVNLNGQYAAFGTVDAAGMAVVNAIVAGCAQYGDANGTIADKSLQPVITSIRIID